LPAAFAGCGCRIHGTDLHGEKAAEQGWVETDQHGASLDDLNADGVLDQATFRTNVSFEFADMNHLPPQLTNGTFDFLWSSCSMEHLGTLRRGAAFVRNAMACLKPGGIAVHTTEFNVSSNNDTVESGATVLYRRRDLEALARPLVADGHAVKLDFSLGALPADQFVDAPPYRPTPHLKLQLGQYVTTSYGIVIQKSPNSMVPFKQQIGDRLRNALRRYRPQRA